MDNAVGRLAAVQVQAGRRVHFTGKRFRHGKSFRRWRPDKSPKQRTMEADLTMLLWDDYSGSGEAAGPRTSGDSTLLQKLDPTSMGSTV